MLAKKSEPAYLCCLYVVTAGLQGVHLGSDETEIVLLIYVIIDRQQNKILGSRQFIVKPSIDNETDTLLSDEVNETTILKEDLVKSVGQTLRHVIYEMDRFLRQTLAIDPDAPEQFAFVTIGQMPLRQCLYPEASGKNLDLFDYYAKFHDLYKEVERYNARLQTALVVYKETQTETDESETNGETKPDGASASATTIVGDVHIQPQHMDDILMSMNMPAQNDGDFYVKEVKDMVNVVQKLIQSGHHFDEPETINLVLEPAIVSKCDEIDSNCIVRARGLPWQSSDQDVAKFFIGLNLEKGGVALCLSAMGRRNGEALVRFVTQEHREMALRRHKHHIGARYIEVYRANGDDFLSVAGGCNSEAHAFLSKGSTVIVRMRGLPYDCTAEQVIEFFLKGDNPVDVMDGVDGVLFVRKLDGRATGDAFVSFADESDSPKALTKHRELIGTRYIELFRSTPAEVQQVFNRVIDPKTFMTVTPQQAAQQAAQKQQAAVTAHVLQAVAAAAAAQQQQQQQHKLPPLPTALPLAPPPPPPNAAGLLAQVQMPQYIVTTGVRKDCLRLRGLPYEADVEHILEFLGKYSQHIAFQGVHMVYNAQRQPSGEAFIQMDSEQIAATVAQLRHHRTMTIGKKQRYVEVFQCSGDDMNVVLTGLPATSPLSPTSTKTTAATNQLLSPDTLTYHQMGWPNDTRQMMGGGCYMSGHPPMFYWQFPPSPPISPTNNYYSHMSAPPHLSPQIMGMSLDHFPLPTNYEVQSPASSPVIVQTEHHDKPLPLMSPVSPILVPHEFGSVSSFDTYVVRVDDLIKNKIAHESALV